MFKVEKKTEREMALDEAPKVTFVAAGSLKKGYEYYLCDRCGIAYTNDDQIAVIFQKDGYADTRCPREIGRFWKKTCLYSLSHCNQETFDKYYKVAPLSR